MLGGRRSFAEGGWAGTPVGEVLPVVARDAANAEVSVSELSGRVRRAPAPSSRSRRSRRPKRPRAAKWNDMPPVATVNAVRQVQAGRDGAADRRPTTAAQDQIVLAYPALRPRARRSRCRCRTRGIWQMDAKMAVTDTTHAMFWRRLRPLARRRRARSGQRHDHRRSRRSRASRSSSPPKCSTRAYVEVNDSRVVGAHHRRRPGKTTEVPVRMDGDQATATTAPTFTPGRVGHLRRRGRRVARSEGSRRGAMHVARLGRRRRVFRRRDARAAPASASPRKPAAVSSLLRQRRVAAGSGRATPAAA